MEDHFQYNKRALRIPGDAVNGLVKVLSVFQEFINGVTREMLGKYVVAYIDDILVYSSSLSVHQVLQRLMSHHFYVKVSVSSELHPLSEISHQTGGSENGGEPGHHGRTMANP